SSEISLALLQAEAGVDPVAGRTHLERIVEAIVDELAGSLVAHPSWCGDRIVRVSDSVIRPDLPPPYCTVGPDLITGPWQLSAHRELAGNVDVTLYYTEDRTHLEPGELSAPSFADYVAFWLSRSRDSRCLVTERFTPGDPRPLVTSSTPQLAEYGDLYPEGDPEGGPLSDRYLVIPLRVEYAVGPDGQPDGWSPDL
ncbi:MAG: hypothetical protein AAFX50_22500, partial [Acidobacteriota bacterium]